MIKISIASDHHGVLIKSKIKTYLDSMDYKIMDLGPSNPDESVDYPDYAKKVCDSILEDEVNFGILICSTGIGMSIAANRYSFVRAALCVNTIMAERARAHNDANVLVLGTVSLTDAEMLEIVKIFLTTSFEGGRHIRRLSKIS